MSRSGALDRPQDGVFKDADHRHTGQVEQRAERGTVGQIHDLAARKIRQRSHQRLGNTEQQGKPPAAGALVTHQLDQARHAQTTGKDGVLGKQGQHGVGKGHTDGIHHSTH